MQETQTLVAIVPDTMTGMRLDQALAQMFPDYSRARLQSWIRSGSITVEGRQIRPRDHANGGEQVRLVLEFEKSDVWEAQNMPLNVKHEDEAVMVVDKPAGLVVHPGAGNRQGTLVNALLHYDPQLAAIPRAGIVHRIDKDTSGLLVVARTLTAHKRLVEQMKEHTVEREYEAVVMGRLLSGGRVEAPIGRHKFHRTRMAVTDGGRPAVTHYRVLNRYGSHTHLRVRLETGRTHQIRVHMAHIGHPLVGDPTYGGRLSIPKGTGATLEATLRGFRRQALHAGGLAFSHPLSGEECAFQSPLPEDIKALLDCLKRTSESG